MQAYSYESNGKTYIYAYYSKEIFSKHRIKYYCPDGNNYVVSEGDRNKNLEVALAIEDYSDILIKPYPNSINGEVRVGFESYGTLTGWTERGKIAVPYTIKANDYTKPTLSMALTPTTSEYEFYMKGVSGVKATFSSGAKCGASIKSYKLRVESKDYTSNHPTNVISSDKLSVNGEVIVTGYVTDTRGFTTEVNQTINVTGIQSQPSFDTVSCSKTTLDGVLSCKYTPCNTAYYSRIYIYAKSGETITQIRSDSLGTATSQRTVSISLTNAELEAIYGKFTHTKTARLKFTLVTYKTSAYSESARLPEEYSIELSLDIPNTSTTKPSIDLITVTPSQVLYQDPNLYVKGKNGAKVSIVATGKYDAGVSTKWEVFGNEYASGATTDTLNLAGKITITVTATDTRGFSSSETREINVLDVGETQIIVSAKTLLTEPISSSITKGNAQFCSRLVFYHGGTQLESKNIGTANTSEISLSKASLAKIYNLNPSSNQAKITVQLLSFTDSTYTYQYGNAISQDVTLKIPNDDSTKPKNMQVTCVPTEYMEGFADVLVNKRSKAKISVGATGQYNASIVSYAISFEGKNYTVNGASGNVVTSLLTTSNLQTIRVVATDSRGFTNTKDIQVRIYDYYTPHVGVADGEDKAVAKRVDAQGNASDKGSWLYIAASKRYASVNGRNNCLLRYRIKTGPNGQYSDYTVLSNYGGNDKYSGVLNLGLDAQAVYYVELSVLDKAKETDSIILIIPTEVVYMDRSGSRDSIAFGGHVTRDRAFEVYRKAYFYGDVILESDNYAWKSLGLDTSVTNSRMSIGRKGPGCYIKRDATDKVQVAFNCAFENANLPLRINGDKIPSEYLPEYDIISVCVAGAPNKSYLAGVAVTTAGEAQIVWLLDVLSGSNVASAAWIDGYIEYFVGEKKT